METKTGANFFGALAVINMLGGETIKGMTDAAYTETYDKFYACKEHDIAGLQTYLLIGFDFWLRIGG